MGETISPDQISRELENVWTSLAVPRGEEGSAGTLRACSMSLLVLAEENDDIQQLGETLASLMPENPSRLILVRVRVAGEKFSQARASAQCWRPFGQRRQICCEQVQIELSDPAFADLPALVAPILVPELPVILWCRSPRLFELPEFPSLAQLASKVLIDSDSFPDPRAILDRMAAAARTGRFFGDLSWARLTRWRELIAQVFENPSYLALLPETVEIRIQLAGKDIPVSVWYFAAWLAEGVRAAGGEGRPAFRSGDATPTGPLERVELIREGEPDLVASVAMIDENTAEIRAGTMVSRAALSRATDSMLLREELAISGRDPIYEKTLPAAAALAISSST